ncbi:MAG: DUF5610 domain-containing protein [Methylococcales bacterium]
MNSATIQAGVSPYSFSARQFKAFPVVADTEKLKNRYTETDPNQPLFNKNPLKLIEHQVVNAIQKAIDTNRVSSASTDDQNLTPDQVADRILALVQQVYGQLQNNDANFDKAEFFAKIKQTIDSSFSTAKELLQKDSGLSAEEIDKNLSAVYGKIQDGLTKLESADPAATAAQAIQLQSYAAQSSQSAEIKVVTKEGDVIKINMAQSRSVSQSAVSIDQNGKQVNALQSSNSSQSSFSVSIEGNLNADEQKSLQELMEDMSKVGSSFFDGKTKSAFKHAQKIGLDTEQLASFSMSMSKQKSVQAVAAYLQTDSPAQQVQPDKIKQAADFVNQAKELIKTAQSALQPFEDPLAVFNDLFKAVDQLSAKDSEPKPAPDSPSLPDIMKPLAQDGLAKEKQV